MKEKKNTPKKKIKKKKKKKRKKERKKEKKRKINGFSFNQMFSLVEKYPDRELILMTLHMVIVCTDKV